MSIKKIIIIVVIVAVAFIGYSMLISGNEKQSASGVSRQAVSSGTSAAAAGSSALLDGPGKEFVTQLLAIQNIKFNLDLFADPVFIGLQDWSREIVPQQTGRPNPFAPLEGGIGLSDSSLSSLSDSDSSFIEAAKASVGSAGGAGAKSSSGGSAGISTVKKTTTTR